VGRISGRERFHQAVGELDVLGRNVAPDAEQQRAQLGARRLRGADALLETAEGVPVPRLHHRIEDVELGGEVRIDTADADAGPLGDVLQRGAIVAALGKQVEGAVHDRLGAVDAQTREVMQAEVDRLWRATKPTILFITHDIHEAIQLGDRIITMPAGPDARFKTIVPVDIAHPRDLTAPAAVALYRNLREDIASEVRRTLQAQGLSREAA
jgi:hypothetical protein